MGHVQNASKLEVGENIMPEGTVSGRVELLFYAVLFSKFPLVLHDELVEKPYTWKH